MAPKVKLLHRSGDEVAQLTWVEAMSAWLEAQREVGARFEVSLALFPGRVHFANDWTTRFCSSSQHLLYFPIEGALEAQVEGQSRIVNTGEFFWAARQASFEFRRVGQAKLVVNRIRLEAQAANGDFLPCPTPFLHLSSTGELGTWMERIVDEMSEPGREHAARMRGLIACLLSEVARASEARLDEKGLFSPAQRAHIRRLLADSQTLPSPRELASALELSPDYFSRCFRRSFGAPPRRFLVEERLRQAARRLLESPRNVSQIAGEFGYSDVFLFSRQFKAHFGHSPTAYRAQHEAIERA